MDINELGFYLFMEEEEKRQKEQNKNDYEEVNVELKSLLVGEKATYKAD